MEALSLNEFEQGRNRSPRGPIGLMKRVYKYVLPEVRSCLDSWRKDAEGIPDPELRKQALASIETKQFHCEGGGIYAMRQFVDETYTDSANCCLSDDQ